MVSKYFAHAIDRLHLHHKIVFKLFRIEEKKQVEREIERERSHNQNKRRKMEVNSGKKQKKEHFKFHPLSLMDSLNQRENGQFHCNGSVSMLNNIDRRLSPLAMPFSHSLDHYIHNLFRRLIEPKVLLQFM